MTVCRAAHAPQRVRVRQVTYRREVRMVPVQRQKKAKNRKGGTHTETVMVRQVHRVPVERWVTRVRQRRQVVYVKVTRRQRVARMVRTCR